MLIIEQVRCSDAYDSGCFLLLIYSVFLRIATQKYSEIRSAARKPVYLESSSRKNISKKTSPRTKDGAATKADTSRQFSIRTPLGFFPSP